MSLRVLALSLLVATTLAAACNNPLAAYYEITLLGTSETQAADAPICKGLNEKDTCCSAGTLTSIKTYFDNRSKEMRDGLGNNMKELKAALNPLEAMEFPEEYKEYADDFKVTLKFVSQTAKKAFRKVNIQTAKCLKQLLRKELGEICSVCDPASGDFVTESSGNLVIKADKNFCGTLETGCTGLIAAWAEVEDAVYESLADAVTYLTALGAGEESEVDLTKIEEGEVALVDDEERREEIIMEKKVVAWADLNAWEKSAYKLNVREQRIFGYREASKEYDDYVPDEESAEEALDNIEQNKNNGGSNNNDSDTSTRRRLYSGYGAAANGTLGMKQGCVARLIEAVIQAINVDGTAAADLINPIKYRIKEWETPCKGSEDLSLGEDEWFIFNDGNSTTDATEDSQQGKVLFNLTIPDNAVIDDSVATNEDVTTFIGKVAQFVSKTQGANAKCYNQTFKDIIEEEEELLRELKSQAGYLAIFKEVAAAKAAGGKTEDELAKMFKDLFFRNQMNDEMEDFQEERRDRREERKESEAADNGEKKNAEDSSKFFANIVTKFFVMGQKDENRFKAEEEVLKGYKRFLENYLRDFYRRMQKDPFMSKVGKPMVEYLRKMETFWGTDLARRKAGTMNADELLSTLYGEWKMAEFTKDNEVNTAIKGILTAQNSPVAYVNAFFMEATQKLPITVPVGASMRVKEQMLRTQMFDWIYDIENLTNVTFNVWNEYKATITDMINKSSDGCQELFTDALRKQGFSPDFTTSWSSGSLPTFKTSVTNRLEAWLEYQTAAEGAFDNLSKHRWGFETLIYTEVGGAKAKEFPKLGAFLADASVDKLVKYWNSKADGDKTSFLDVCKTDAKTQYDAMVAGTATKGQLLYAFTKSTDEELYARMFSGPKGTVDVFNFPNYLDKRMTEAERTGVPGASDKVDKLKIATLDDAGITKKCETLAKLGVLLTQDPADLYATINPLETDELALLTTQLVNKPLDMFGFADNLDHQFSVLMGYTNGLPDKKKRDSDGNNDNSGGNNNNNNNGGNNSSSGPNLDLSKGPVYYEFLFTSLSDSAKQAVIDGIKAALTTPGTILAPAAKFYKIQAIDKANKTSLEGNPFTPAGLKTKDDDITLPDETINELMMLRFQWITFFNNGMRFKREIPDKGRVKKKQNKLVAKDKWKTVTDAEKVQNFKKSSRYSAATGLELDPSIELPSLESSQFTYEQPCDPSQTDACETFICEELAADPSILTSMETATPEAIPARRRLADNISYNYVETGGMDVSAQADSAGVTVDSSVDGVDENSSENLDQADTVDQSAVDSAVKDVENTNTAAGDGSGGDGNGNGNGDEGDDKPDESKDSATSIFVSVLAIFAALFI